MNKMRTLYAPCEPYAVHTISVETPHQLYVEESGNKGGIPVIFLHGGPGSGCAPGHRRYFDPEAYRIILFDQRGSGKSQPSGELSNNNIHALVADLEAIRDHLGISKWLLFGGSWGATLGLFYALTHSERVLGMILRGAFLARESDLDWFFFDLRRLFPEAWYKLSKQVPSCRSSADLIDWYHAAVHGDDSGLSLQAARSWSEWGNHVVYWHRNSDTEAPSNAEPETDARNQRLIAKVKIETYYAKHRYFMAENELLDRIGSLTPMAVTLVHGLFDLTCSMESAWLLHQAIPNSEFIQLREAGHLIDEPAMIAALVEESDRMRTRLATCQR